MSRAPRSRGLRLSASLLALVLLPACAGSDSASQPPPPPPISAELQETEAGAALMDALAQARASDRLVFLHTGADW